MADFVGLELIPTGQKPQKNIFQDVADKAVDLFSNTTTDKTPYDEGGNAYNAAQGLASAYGVASQQDADQEARDREMANQLNVPTYVVQTSPELRKEAMRIAQAKQNAPEDWNQFTQDNPATAKYLSDPANMAVSHDDVHGLSAMEKTIQTFSNSWELGELRQKRAEIGMKLWDKGNDMDSLDADTKDHLVRLNNRMAELNDVSPKNPWSVDGVVSGIASMGPGAAHAVKIGTAAGVASGALAGVGGLLGGPLAEVTVPVAAMSGFGYGFTSGFAEDFGKDAWGNTNLDLMMKRDANGKPMDTTSAMIGAAVAGTGMAALGLVGIGRLMSKVPGGQEIMNIFKKTVPEELLANPATTTAVWRVFTQNYIQSVAEQSAIGGLMAGTTIAGEKAAELTAEWLSNQTFKHNPNEPGALEQMGQAAFDMVPVAGALSFAPHAMGLARDMKLKQMGDVQQRALEKLADGLMDSKTLERYPEATRNFLEHAAKDGPLENVYIPADKLVEYFQKRSPEHPEVAQGILDQLNIGEQLPEAIATGGNVKIPLKDFAATLGRTEHFKNLIPDMKFNENDLTHRQQQEYYQDHADTFRKIAAGEITVDNLEGPASENHQQVHEIIKEKIMGAGYGEAQAEFNAKIFSHLAHSYGERAKGVFDPIEWVKKIDIQQSKNDKGQYYQFAGGKAETADHLQLGKAKELESQGKSKEEIRQATGWTKGMDQKWRFEIDDSKAVLIDRSSLQTLEAKVSSLYKQAHRVKDKSKSKELLSQADSLANEYTQKKTAILGNALDHPDLYKAYPWLADTKVVFSDLPKGDNGSYDPSIHTIEVNKNLSPEQTKATLLHEIQHVIQSHEGFAGGGSPERFKDKKGETAHSQYRRMAGEIEARDTAGRANLTPEGRLDTPPDHRSNAIIAHNNGEVIYNQGKSEHRGSITFKEDGGSLIKIFQAKDSSTMLHEGGHLFLETLKTLSETEGVPEELKADYQKVRDWVGAKEGEALTVEQHEQFARGFETYLMEGQAPSSGLLRVFNKFRTWLTKIYKDATELGAELTPEVRGVMDRMLATDQEIQNVEGFKQYGNLTGKKELNVSDYKQYIAAIQRSHDAAVSSLLKRKMAELSPEFQERLKTATTAEREKLEEEIANEPIYLAMRDIGKMSSNIKDTIKSKVHDELTRDPLYMARAAMSAPANKADVLASIANRKQEMIDDHVRMLVKNSKLGIKRKIEVRDQEGNNTGDWLAGHSNNQDWYREMLSRQAGGKLPPGWSKYIDQVNKGKVDAVMPKRMRNEYERIAKEQLENGSYDELHGEIPPDGEFHALQKGLLSWETVMDAGGGLKLNDLHTRANFGELVDQIPKNMITKTGHFNADKVAEIFGFSSGKELLQRVAESKNFAAELKDRIAAELKDFTDTSNIKKIAELYREDNLSENQTIHFELLTEAHGYTSGDHLAQEIIRSPSWKEKVDSRLSEFKAAFKKEQLGDMKDEAMKAIHNEHALEVLASESELFSQWATEKSDKDAKKKEQRIEQEVHRMARHAQLRTKQALETARESIAAKKISLATTWRNYFMLERHAKDNAERLLRAGDYEGAAKAKNSEIFNHAMGIEAVKAEKVVNKITAQINEIAKKKKEVFKHDSHFHQIAEMLQRFELAERKDYDPLQREETLQEWAKRLNADLGTVAIPEWLLNENEKGNYKNFTIDQLSDVRDALKNIQKVANQEKTSVAIAKGEELQVIMNRLVDVADKNVKDSYKAKMQNETNIDKFKSTVKGYLYSLKKFRTIAEKLQGWEDSGEWTKVWIDKVHEQASLESKHVQVLKELITDAWAGYSKKERANIANKPIFYEELGTSAEKMKLIVMALNLGNKGNKEKLFKTRPVGVPMTSPWGEHIVMSLLQNNLNKRDWELVQKHWDAVNQPWPELSKMHHEMAGFEPGKIEAVPLSVTTKEGDVINLRGGYFPLKEDFRSSLKAAAREAENSPLYTEENPAWIASTRTGATKERTNAQYPITLDINHMYQHLFDVVHDIHFRPLITDYRRILNDKHFQQFVKGKLGPEGLTALSDHVMNVAGGNKMGELGMSEWARAANYFRSHTTQAILMWRLGTLTQNVANIALYPKALKDFGYGDVVSGIIRYGILDYIPKTAFYWKAAAKIREEVYKLSAFMRDKRETPDYTLKETHNSLTGQESELMKFGTTWLAGTDDLINIPMWKQAYTKEMNRSGNSDKAVLYADQLVEAVAGSGRKYDLAPVIRSQDPMVKLMSMFYSFLSTQHNRWEKETGLIMKERKNLPRFLGYVATNLIIFPLVSALLANKGPGKGDDDGTWWANEVISYPIQFLPGVRDVATVALDQALGLKSFGYRPSPVAAQVENVLKVLSTATAYSNNKATGQQLVESGAKVASFFKPYPDQFNAYFFNAYDYIENGMNPEGGDLFRRRPKRDR